jgi:phosphatidylserine decarboxylase
MTIARWGIIPILFTIGVLGWGAWLLPSGWIQDIGIAVAVAATLFVLWFFRNPARTPQGGPETLTAPADGLVDDIAEAEHPALGGPAVRVGIFLSVFDVHVNRSPCDGTVVDASYRPGAFLDVRDPECRDRNEQNELVIEAAPAVAPGLRLVVRQIAGLIARRIICTHGVGDRVERGKLFGMIRFGSRTEVWIPKDQPHTVVVALGQRVKCGETPLIRLERRP